MIATGYSSLEVMQKLVSLGADPNIINNTTGDSALSYAFESENIYAIKMLLKLNINRGIEKCIECLAKSDAPIIDEIKTFLEKNLKVQSSFFGDHVSLLDSLKPSTEFGNLQL